MSAGSEFEAELALETVAGRLLGRQRRVAIGRYELRERLGRGGCGVVFAAYDPDLDRQIAIKVVRPGREDGLEPQIRLLREAQALAQVRHPNIVEVLDVIEDPGPPPTVCVVMERLYGEDLRAWVARLNPGWRRIVHAYLEAAAGLEAAHRVGLVHRDFKPANVMIDDAGRVKVLDFGLVYATANSTDPRGVSTGLTSTGALVGTVRYMAPEQHSHATLTPATDVFGWCASLYGALHGRHAFDGEAATALSEAKLEGRIAAPMNEQVPSRINRALRRGMQPDAAARPSLATLRGLLEPPQNRARRWIGAAFIIAVPTVFLATAARTERPEAATEVIAPVERTPAEESELRALHRRAESIGDDAIARETAEAWIEQSLVRATALDDPLLLSKLHQAHAQILVAEWELDAAAQAAREAVWIAISAGEPERAVAAMPLFIDVTGRQKGDTERSAKLAARAEEWIHELGNPPQLVALHGTVRARELIMTGRHAEARALLDPALKTFEELGWSAYGHVQCLLAATALDIEENSVAAATLHQRRAIEVLDLAGDPDDLRYSDALQLAGEIAYMQGDFVAAANAYRRAVERLEAGYGPGHPKLAWPIAFLGTLEHGAGNKEEGVMLVERGLRIAKDNGAPPDLIADIEHNRKLLD